MKNLLGAIFLLVGAVLLIWGVHALRWLSAHRAEVAQGASNEVVVMVTLGALLGVTGLVRLVRRV